MATRPILFAEHALLRFGGGLGADTWSCGIRLAGSPASSDTAFCEDNLDAAADAVKTWWTAFPQGVSAYFNGLANLSWVKLNAIAPSGRYQDTNNTNLVEIQPAIAPSGNASLVAPQLSICLTLRTANKRGLAHVGRIYVPAATGSVTGTGVIPQALCEALAAHTSNFIGDLNGLDNLYAASVVSPHAEAHNPITRVDVGNVLDTQQRRRRQIDETYFGSDV